MLIFERAYFLAIFLCVAVVLVKCGDDDKSDEEEKDPWDKSTDKYRHNSGSSNSKDAEEPVKIDVTEVSESEVHSSRSKLCKNCKSNIVKDTPKPANKTNKTAPPVLALKKEIDDETKEQIKDAIDEQVFER